MFLLGEEEKQKVECLHRTQLSFFFTKILQNTKKQETNFT